MKSPAIRGAATYAAKELEALHKMAAKPNTPASRPNVAGIEARVKAATEGPWHTSTDGTGHRNTLINAPHSFVCTLDLPRGPARKANAEFIAHARQDIPALIAYIGRLEERIEELDGKVYLKGHWRCPKCDFYCVSTLIDAGTGKFAADQEPQKCANGCGPMWRVTHEESANNMVAHAEKQADRIEELEGKPKKETAAIEQDVATMESVSDA